LKTRAAVLFEVGKRLDIREVDLEPPRMREVMIKMAAAGVGGDSPSARAQVEG
jgi:Zn-dependent alcohol dehydrogenase